MAKKQKAPVFKQGTKVKCTGVAYFHSAPFDAKGEEGVVTHVEGENIFFDHASRGNVMAPASALKVVK